MTPRLGLVCITTSTEGRYRTVRRKRLLEPAPAAQRKLLDDIYRDNIQTFDGALRFCTREGCRLALENDEYAYGADEIAAICRRSGVPMVFDAHHHIVHDALPSYEHPSVAAMLQEARSTWADPSQQLVHISNGRTAFNDRQHAALITAMPSSYRQAPWIEVEAKSKEEAIRELAGWLQG